MKIIERKIGGYFCAKAARPIRQKKDIIILLLETLKLVNGSDETVENEKGKILIYIDKMSRIFYETEDKIFSLCFPFSLEEQENSYYRIYDSQTDQDVTDQMISLLISIVQNDEKHVESLDSVMDSIIENAEEYEYEDINEIWRLLFKLWYMEDGYIRYDYDFEHENGKLHPRYHLDVNYSPGATYKIGLINPLQIEELKNIVDTTTECLYLSAW